ncbi:hypothetical protein GIS00_13465 [Nakamurella sp. YIM 132087]|uniref:Uncharacterized protein n=1 Tax=Nakamurella alba TaxID=2665158 RepID=A0A7K1FLH1_9ACTN|nr:hypothetical protein [Nakamurella alba]MTD14948.1 hypothetical protein [Nakamurella alba]
MTDPGQFAGVSEAFASGVEADGADLVEQAVPVGDPAASDGLAVFGDADPIDGTADGAAAPHKDAPPGLEGYRLG